MFIIQTTGMVRKYMAGSPTNTQYARWTSEWTSAHTFNDLGAACECIEMLELETGKNGYAISRSCNATKSLIDNLSSL